MDEKGIDKKKILKEFYSLKNQYCDNFFILVVAAQDTKELDNLSFKEAMDIITNLYLEICYSERGSEAI